MNFCHFLFCFVIYLFFIFFGFLEFSIEGFLSLLFYVTGKLNIVDENMSILTERIEELRMNERLQRYCRGLVGWNYPSYYDTKLKRERRLSESLEIAGLVVGTIGFTFLTGTLCLCLVSLVIRLVR